MKGKCGRRRCLVVNPRLFYESKRIGIVAPRSIIAGEEFALGLELLGLGSRVFSDPIDATHRRGEDNERRYYEKLREVPPLSPKEGEREEISRAPLGRASSRHIRRIVRRLPGPRRRDDDDDGPPIADGRKKTSTTTKKKKTTTATTTDGEGPAPSSPPPRVVGGRLGSRLRGKEEGKDGRRERRRSRSRRDWRRRRRGGR